MPFIQTNVDNTYILSQIYLLTTQVNRLNNTVSRLPQSGNTSGSGILHYDNAVDFAQATPVLGTPAILEDTVYGGGIFSAQSTDDGFVVDNWRVFSTGTSGVVWVRNLEQTNLVKMDWFGIQSGYVDDISLAISAALDYLEEGGTIELGAGDFYISTRLMFDKDNITLKGAGQNLTKIHAIGNAGGFQPNSGYRYVGWEYGNMITYDDSDLAIGRGYLDLRVEEDAANFEPGTKVFINGGASQYDQNYGEFNIVDYVIGSRVYFKYNLSRDYTQELSSWSSTLTQDFTPPAEGQTATVHYSGTQLNGAEGPISIGNDLYQIMSATSSTADIMNLANKGNGVDVIPTGTHIFKYRAIVLTPTTVYNSKLQDLTIDGVVNAIVASNSIKTHIQNVTFNWFPDDPFTGGQWLDGDDGRDFFMENCEVHCAYLFKCQFARSFSDIKLCHTKFFNATLEFSEFNINVEVYSNDFHLRYSGFPNEMNAPAVTFGTTCSNVRFHDNNVYASGMSTVFGSGEIQIFNAIGSRDIYINNNVIVCDNIGYVFNEGNFSNIQILHNTISGKANLLYGMSAAEYLEGDSRFDSGNQFGFGSRCLYAYNTFAGYVDGFGVAKPNVEYVGNYTNRFGDAGQSIEFNTWGNVLYNHFTLPDAAENFVLKDNVFKNWNLLGNSITYNFPLDDHVEICNNKFFDNSGGATIISQSCAHVES